MALEFLLLSAAALCFGYALVSVEGEAGFLAALGITLASLGMFIAVRSHRTTLEDRGVERLERLGIYLIELAERVDGARRSPRAGGWASARLSQRKVRFALAALSRDIDLAGELLEAQAAVRYQVDARHAQEIYDGARAGVHEVERAIALLPDAERRERESVKPAA